MQRYVEQTDDSAAAATKTEAVAFSDDSAKLLGVLDMVVRKKRTLDIDKSTQMAASKQAEPTGPSTTGTQEADQSLGVKVRITSVEGEEEGEEDDADQSEDDEEEELKTFPKPWLDIEGNFLVGEFRRFASAVISAVQNAPGISQDTLVDKMKVALSKKDLLSLIDHLLRHKNIISRVVYKSSGIPSLFSRPTEISGLSLFVFLLLFSLLFSVSPGY